VAVTGEMGVGEGVVCFGWALGVYIGNMLSSEEGCLFRINPMFRPILKDRVTSKTITNPIQSLRIKSY
jgi:hypothetical protein